MKFLLVLVLIACVFAGIQTAHIEKVLDQIPPIVQTAIENKIKKTATQIHHGIADRLDALQKRMSGTTLPTVPLPTPQHLNTATPKPVVTPKPTPVKTTPVTITKQPKNVYKYPYSVHSKKKFTDAGTHHSLPDEMFGAQITTWRGYLWSWFIPLVYWDYIGAYAEYDASPAGLKKKATAIKMSQSLNNADFKYYLYPRIKDSSAGVFTAAEWNIVKGLLDGITESVSNADPVAFYFDNGTTKLFFKDIEKSSTTLMTEANFDTLRKVFRAYLVKE